MTEATEKPRNITVPDVWKTCVLKGLGGGISQSANVAIMEEFRRGVGEYVSDSLGRVATEEDVANVEEIALGSDESPEVCKLRLKALDAGERAAIKRSDFFEGLMTTMVSQFGVRLIVDYKKGIAYFSEPLFNQDKLPAFLAELARQCPQLEVAWK